MTHKEYNEIVDKCADDLYRFAMRYTADRQLAQDAVQDGFVVLWEHRSEVDKEKAKGYLLRVMYRKMVDQHRRTKMQLAKNDELKGDESFSPHLNFDLHDALQNAINQLPEQQKVLLLLRDLEGYSYREIAEMTKLSDQQVMVYLYRARVAMKKLLKDYQL